MERVEEALGRAAAAMVDVASRHIAATLLVSLALTGASLWLAATTLTVDTDSNRLLADLFPSLQDNVVVMIEADDAQDAVSALLKAGADANSRDGDGRTPAWYAARRGLPLIVEALRP